MSWATCYSGSNNIYHNFPPIMSDGRNYAGWQPDAVINNRIRSSAGIQSNWQYRQYLQQNATKLMEHNFNDYCHEMGMPTHVTVDTTPSTNVPHLYKNTFDTSLPGFGYCSSDIKSPYLTREQLNARLISPTVSFR